MSQDGLFGLGFDPIKQHPGYPGRTGYGKTDVLTVGNKGSAVSFQAIFGEVDQFTVQIDVDTTALKTPNVVKTMATISFKVEGNTIKRVYDVSQGLSISGNATAISVDINDDSPIPTGTAEQYRVTITAGRFTRPGSATPPVRTGGFASVPAGGSMTVPVLPGANGVAVYGSQFAGSTIEQIAFDHTPIAAGTVVFKSDVTIGQYVPLVSGAAYVKVTNPSANPTDVTVVFSIDG